MNRHCILGALGLLLLIGCGEDARVAGGSGSHLPQPMARLLDSNLQEVGAGVWRLWRVDGEKVLADTQFVDSAGFPVPESGLWVVEAWSDTVHAGSIRGLAAAPYHDSSACAHSLTYLGGVERPVVGVQPCGLITPPSMASRPGRPIGVGVFGAAIPIQKVIPLYVLKSNQRSNAYRFQIWQIDPSQTKGKGLGMGATSIDSVKVRYSDTLVSPLHGTVDITRKSGLWLFEGWSAALEQDSVVRSEWFQPPKERWVNSQIIDSCMAHASACQDQPGGISRTRQAEIYLVVTGSN